MPPQRLFDPGLRGLSTSTMTVIAVAAYNNLSVGAALPAIGDDLGNLDLLPWVVTVELITSAIAGTMCSRAKSRSATPSARVPSGVRMSAITPAGNRPARRA